MFKVLHSSAGAGKTHALVKEYLFLALKDESPSNYTRVLALTFTTKAAGEMRERVLMYLEALASGHELTGREANVQDHIMEQAQLSRAELHGRAQAMLTHMLHHWSQVAISTIDSFTRRVVQPFARELQLDHELKMTTVEDYYRAKAVDLLLEDAGSDPALTEVLVETCEKLLEDEKVWRPDVPLTALSKQLSQEGALKHLELLKETSSERFIAIQRELKARVNSAREQIRQLGQKVMKAVADAGLQEDDFPRKKNGYIGYFRKLGQMEGGMVQSTSIISAVQQGNWTAKSTPEGTATVIEGLSGLFTQVYHEVEALGRQYTLDRAILNDLLPMASLNAIDQRLEELKREDGVSFFSDLTRKVHAVVQEEPAPFIYERLGERYAHFLVDEFQDTSLMQWHAMLPLVENALSKGGTVLLVGDAKQAIYRWRNGEARQFTEFPKVFRKDMLVRGDAYQAALLRSYEPQEPLATNRRSAMAIIDFNNEVTDVLMQQLGPEERKVYHRHQQEKNKAVKGYVEVNCYPKEKRRSAQEEEDEGDGSGAWELMKQAVEDCLEDGFNLNDIAVLVRTKRQGAMASDHLRSAGYAVISPDGLTLGANQVACAVIEVLAWLHSPVDEHAAKAAQSIASIVADAGTTDPFPGGMKPMEFMRQWQGAHPHINARLPIVPLITRIAIALRHDPAHDAFTMALLNEAHAFTKGQGDDLPGFLEQWERSVNGRSVGGASRKDAIHVMTVHKAKGLQFPVVIIPEAGKSAKGNKGERIWIAPDPTMEGLPAALVKNTRSLLEIEIPEAIEEYRLSRLDDLDVLYVALTRPEERLYISVIDSGNDFLAKALREHLGLAAGGVHAKGERSKKQVEEKHQGEKKAEQPVPDTRFVLSLGEEGGERQWNIRNDAPEEWDPADPDPYRSHGQAIHAILARVRTAADLQEAIVQERNNWGLPEDQVEAIGKNLAQLLKKVDVAPFFSAGLEVFNEYTLLDEEGRAARPDRVVRDGKRLRVLDIKTGRPHDGHSDQVRKYMRLLEAVEHGSVEGWLLYAAEGEVIPFSH